MVVVTYPQYTNCHGFIISPCVRRVLKRSTAYLMERSLRLLICRDAKANEEKAFVSAKINC